MDKHLCAYFFKVIALDIQMDSMSASYPHDNVFNVNELSHKLCHWLALRM